MPSENDGLTEWDQWVWFRDHTLRTPRLDHTGPERYRERTELPANNLANAKTPLLWDGPWQKQRSPTYLGLSTCTQRWRPCLEWDQQFPWNTPTSLTALYPDLETVQNSSGMGGISECLSECSVWFGSLLLLDVTHTAIQQAWWHLGIFLYWSSWKTQILMNLLELDENLTILTLHVSVNPMAIQPRISPTFLWTPFADLLMSR